MGTVNHQAAIAGSVPATGGSGGGPNKDLLPTPEPQAILGLNSTVVYGGNVAIAFPLNFQMALGSNLQVCISPNASAIYQPAAGGLVPSLPGPMNDWLGSGLGGNMQMTMGTSANFVMGQIFDINLGPRRITLDVHTVTGVQSCIPVIGKLIMASAWVFTLGYISIPDDDGRSVFVMLYQLAMQLMMVALMDTQGRYGQMDAYYKSMLNTTFAADPAHPHVEPPGTLPTPDNPHPGSDLDRFGAAFNGASTIGADSKSATLAFATIMPVLVEIAGEIKLDVTPQTS